MLHTLNLNFKINEFLLSEEIFQISKSLLQGFEAHLNQFGRNQIYFLRTALEFFLLYFFPDLPPMWLPGNFTHTRKSAMAICYHINNFLLISAHTHTHTTPARYEVRTIIKLRASTTSPNASDASVGRIFV